jgi:hypothetical protein
MRTDSRRRKVRAWLTGGIVGLAIAVRIAAVLVLQSHHVPRSTYEHGEIAANLLAGRGFAIRFLGADGPTSQQAPVYPGLLAIAYAIGGVDTPRALLLLELAQALLGGLLVLGVVRLGRHASPDRPDAALLAGLLTALHPTLIYATTHIQVALLGATLLTWTLLCAFRVGETGRNLAAVGTGCVLALSALTDPILGLSLIGVAFAIALGRRSHPRPLLQTVRLIALVILTTGLGILPWIARNALVHGELVPIKSTFGYAFWQGNCSLSQGTDKVVRESVERVLSRNQSSGGLEALNRTLWAARHKAGYLDDIALTAEDRRLLGLVSEPERSRILFRRAIQDLRAEPGRYLKLCLRRFRYFWLFDETNPKTRVLSYRVSHLGLTVLGFLGLAICGRDMRRRLLPTTSTALLISLFHTATIVSTRFHIPIEPLMALWAGAGLARWTGRLAGAGSTAAGDHVVSIGVVRRLRREVISGLRGLPAAHQHPSKHETADHGGGADHEGAAPSDGDHRQIV